jgi:hypothetical protein
MYSFTFLIIQPIIEKFGCMADSDIQLSTCRFYYAASLAQFHYLTRNPDLTT